MLDIAHAPFYFSRRMQWLVAAFPLCAITVVLGGVSVFTNSWARLNDTHIGLFTACGINLTSMASVCVEHGVAECTRSPTEECYEGIG